MTLPANALIPADRIDHIEMRVLSSRLEAGLTVAGMSLTGERRLPVVRLRAGGRHGYGESPPLPTFTGLDADATLAAMGEAQARLLHLGPRDALEALHASPLLPGPVRCAFDVAIHDLIGRARGVPVDRLLGPRRQEEVRISRAIGYGRPDEVERLVRGYRARGVTAFKVKVGRGLDQDLAAVAAVRTTAGEEHEVAIDANASLTRDEAVALTRAVRPYGVAYFEQPVARDDLDGLRAVGREGLPVMADESAFDAADVVRLAKAKAVSLVGIKLIKCGGLAPAMEMVRAGLRHGLFMTVIDPLGSAISLNAGLAVAVQIPPHPFAHGLSAGFDVDAPFAPHRDVIEGWLGPSDLPGLGVDVAWPESEQAA